MKTYRCDICEKDYASQSGVRYHKMRAHGGTTDQRTRSPKKKGVAISAPAALASSKSSPLDTPSLSPPSSSGGGVPSKYYLQHRLLQPQSSLVDTRSISVTTLMAAAAAVGTRPVTASRDTNNNHNNIVSERDVVEKKKICRGERGCGVEKPISAFSDRQGLCKKCRNKRDAERRRNRQATAVAAELMKKCNAKVSCGDEKPVVPSSMSSDSKAEDCAEREAGLEGVASLFKAVSVVTGGFHAAVSFQ